MFDKPTAQLGEKIKKFLLNYVKYSKIEMLLKHKSLKIIFIRKSIEK